MILYFESDKMALYDNKLWMLSHIYHSFTTGDESGVSELVLTNGNLKNDLHVVAENQGLSSFISCISEDEDEDDDGCGGRSPDIRGADPSWMPPQHSTKMQTSKIQKEKCNGTAPKLVVWKAGSADEEELEHMFPRKQLPAQHQLVPGAEGGGRKVSLLSHLLDNLTIEDTNPWLDYAKFDASGSFDNKASRKMTIYFPFCTVEETRSLSIVVTCFREISIQDLVGLSMLQYTTQRRVPRVTPPVEKLSLCMCEEDGTVDSDFPPLIMSDPLSKYGFNVLAVVLVNQLGDGCSIQESNALCVTLHMPDGTFSQLEIQDKTITLGELTELGLERRKYLQKAKYKFNYHLEAPDEPGIALDPKHTLSSQDGTEFYIVRDNSKRVCDLQSGGGAAPNFLEAHLYQSFNVEIFTKVRTKVDIHLGISGDKVEIDPRQQSSSAKFWSKQKAVSYTLDKVVSCDILDKNKSGLSSRVIFRMVYLSDSGWAHKDFEAEREVANEVVQKLGYLLDQKQSVARQQRREYMQNKVKKRERVRTITN